MKTNLIIRFGDFCSGCERSLCAPRCALLFIALVLTSFQGFVFAQAPVHNAKVISTNLLGFGVPFEVNPNDSSIIEVQLYLSEDQGKTWSFYGRQSTDKQEFPFRTSSDGEYWFALKTLNRNRQLLPEGKTAPGLIMLVDTIKPELSFQIQNDPAGRVGCRWRAYDKNIVPEKLQILYQPIGAAADDWKQVPVRLGGVARNGLYADQVAWWPETTARSLNVRITIADAAGNQVSQDRTVNVPPTPWKHRSSATARTGSAATQYPAINQSQQHQTQQHQTAQAGEPDSVADFQMAMNSITSEPVNNQKADTQRMGMERNGGLPRTAMNQNPGLTNMPLIGEPPEYAAPPNPDDFTSGDATMGQHLANQISSGSGTGHRTSKPSQPNSVTWESEPERWNPRSRSTSSTTNQPDPRILPNPFVQQAIRTNDHLPQSNPTTMKTVGDQVVGESTTMGSSGGSSNQYQGLAPLPIQESGKLPTFLPGQPSNASAERIVANSEFQRQGESAFSDSAAPRSQQSAGGFSSAGFNRSSNGLNNGQNQNANEEAGQGGGANDMQRLPPRGSAGQQRIERPNQNDRYTGERQSVMSAKPVVDSTDPRDAATEMISTKRFRLNYGIDAIDPSGVAKVDLWMTRDGGRTWDSWGSDPDNASPFPVEVQDEGRYGFRIVVHSKDGLTGRGPSSGDAADMWVHVDSQSPLARITSVPYGRGDEAGRLVINYSVNDPFLVLRPITLSYSRGPTGPWTMIGEGLRNEGRYVWKPTANVPDRIFLRIDARDTAGNVGVHQLSQAIDVSGLIPRGTIHGVTPVGN